jgi:hypothetical protein
MYIERIVVVILLSVFTSIIPNFIAFLNIVGALGTSVLGFIFPPIYLIQFYGRKNIPVYVFLFNIFLICFGVFGGAYSIFNSIKDMVK